MKVWGVFQLLVVKLRDAGDTVAFAGVPLVASTVTLAVGSLAKTTV